MSQQVLFHLKESYRDSLQELGYSFKLNDGELDVILPDVEYNANHSLVDPDEQICDHYNIDYDYVNCIELV